MLRRALVALAFAVALVPLPAAAGAITVRETLLNYGIPSSAVPDDVLDRVPVQVTIAHDGNVLWLLAAFDRRRRPDGYETAPALFRYDPSGEQTRWTVIAKSSRTRASFRPYGMSLHPEVTLECGTPNYLDQARDGRAYLTSEFSPSAACTLVVGSDLAVKAALGGWIATNVSGRYDLVIESMIHFAPTHPERLEVYDEQTNHVEEVFPFAADAVRNRYVARAGAELRPTTAHACTNCDRDPEHIDCALTAFEAHAAAWFAFSAHYSADRIDTVAPIAPLDVRYTFAMRDGRWVPSSPPPPHSVPATH